jgi:histidinol-phosphatase
VKAQAITQRLEFAKAIALSLSEYQRGVVQQNCSLERKQDGTPVTVVDQESERSFRQAVAEHFPEDGILGEEAGETGQSQTGRWVIDPIDGTRKFMRGLPFWGICIAYETNGEVQLGVIAIPGAHLLYAAQKGCGATCNDKPIRIDDSTEEPRHSIITMPPRACFVEAGWATVFDGVQQWIEHDPGFLDAYSYGLVADGRLHGLVSCGDKWWDIAAAVCIVREAGGVFVALDGSEPKEGSLNIAASPATAKWLLPRLQKLGL